MASNNNTPTTPSDDPFGQIFKGTELGVDSKVTQANAATPNKDDPFAGLVPVQQAQDTDNPEESKAGFLERFSHARIFSGVKEEIGKYSSGQQSLGATVGNANKALMSNAWNLIEGNTFANDARVITGSSNYAADVDTLTQELNDTNARMAELVKQRKAGVKVDPNYYRDLSSRQVMYSTQLGQVADAATQASHTWDNLRAGLSKQAQEFKDNPTGAAGDLAGGMLDSMLQDPELMLLGGASTNIKRIAAANGIAAKAANLGIDLANNKFARGSVEGAALIAPIDMAQQLNEKNYVDYGQTGATVMSGMLLGVFNKAVFNNRAIAKASDGARNTILAKMSSGKTPLESIVKEVTDDVASHEAAEAAGVEGGDYTVESLMPQNIKLATKKAFDDIEEMSKEAVSTKNIDVSDVSNAALLANANRVMDNRANGVSADPLQNSGRRASVKGYTVQEIQPDENIEVSEQGGARAPKSFRSFGKDVTGFEEPTMNITGNKFAFDIHDDDGFPMGEVRGHIDNNIVQPLINAAADRDTMLYPNAAFRAWEALTKYALSTGRTFTGFISADAGVRDWLSDMRAKGYKVVDNHNRAFDVNTNTWKSTDFKPLFTIVGHEGNMPAPEVIEAKNTLQTSYNDYMAGEPTGRNLQAGNVKLGALVPMALFGAGFAYGYHAQQSIMQGFKDGALAASLTLVPAALGMIGPLSKGIVNGIAGTGKDHYSLGKFGENFNNRIQSTIPWKAYVFRNAINSILGATENHHRTFMALHGDPDARAKLNTNERKVFDTVRAMNEGLGKLGAQEGVLDEVMNDFFSRWLKPGPNAPKEARENWGKYKMWQSRKFKPGFEGLNEALSAGYLPVTENIGEIMQNYMTSMYRAIDLKRFASAAKTFTFADGTQALLPSDKAPKNYIPVKGALYGFSAHPDVANSFNFLMDFPEFSKLEKAYDFVNYGMKRGQLNIAAFHPAQLAKNYTFANIGGGAMDMVFHGNALGVPEGAYNTVKGMANSLNPNSAIHKMIRNGDPMIQEYLKSGGTLSLGRATEDFSSDSFFSSLENTSKWLDSLPLDSGQGAKSLVDAYTKLSHLNDKVAFEMIQNYFKVDTYMREVEKQTQVAWNKHLRQPDKFDEPNNDAIKHSVAMYVNDLYGGQNYYQIAEDTNNWLMKNVKQELFNPTARRKVLQRLEYAPDWTLSVIRGATQAMPGLADSELGGKLHRRFMLGMGIMAFTAANAVNHHYTGKYLWQNGNPGYIDLGNGYRMQWDKQLSELWDMSTDFPKWTVNRMAAFPRLGMELATNQQYISKYHAPPIVPKGDTGWKEAGDYAAHIGAQYLPIAAHQVMESSSGRAEFSREAAMNAMGSEIGFPIYKNPGSTNNVGSAYNPKYIENLLKQYKPKVR